MNKTQGFISTMLLVILVGWNEQAGADMGMLPPIVISEPTKPWNDSITEEYKDPDDLDCEKEIRKASCSVPGTVAVIGLEAAGKISRPIGCSKIDDTLAVVFTAIASAKLAYENAVSIAEKKVQINKIAELITTLGTAFGCEMAECMTAISNFVSVTANVACFAKDLVEHWRDCVINDLDVQMCKDGLPIKKNMVLRDKYRCDYVITVNGCDEKGLALKDERTLERECAVEVRKGRAGGRIERLEYGSCMKTCITRSKSSCAYKLMKQRIQTSTPIPNQGYQPASTPTSTPIPSQGYQPASTPTSTPIPSQGAVDLSIPTQMYLGK